MKALVIAVSCCVLHFGIVSAETTREEKGKRILQEGVQALGGDAFKQVKDRVETGRAYSFYRERLTGLSRARIYTRYLTKREGNDPDMLLQRERQAFGKDEDSIVLLLDKEGYQLTFRGAKPLPKEQIERYRLSTTMNFLYIVRHRLDEPGLIIEHKSSDVFENMPVDLVDITDSQNRTVTVYFHRTTHLPVRQVFYRRDPESKERIEEVTIFSKFRDVGGGVMWPFNILRLRDGEKIYEIFAESVTINNDLKDDLFTLPAGSKILDKKSN